MRNQYSTRLILKTSVDLVSTANLVGQTIRVATAGHGDILYEFTVTSRNKHKGGNEITITGYVTYAGSMKIKAKIWIRNRDGREILGIDIRDLARQEEAARVAPQTEPRLRW
jgi:hypothetical protein